MPWAEAWADIYEWKLDKATLEWLLSFHLERTFPLGENQPSGLCCVLDIYDLYINVNMKLKKGKNGTTCPVVASAPFFPFRWTAWYPTQPGQLLNRSCQVGMRLKWQSSEWKVERCISKWCFLPTTNFAGVPGVSFSWIMTVCSPGSPWKAVGVSHTYLYTYKNVQAY